VSAGRAFRAVAADVLPSLLKEANGGRKGSTLLIMSATFSKPSEWFLTACGLKHLKVFVVALNESTVQPFVPTTASFRAIAAASSFLHWCVRNFFIIDCQFNEAIANISFLLDLAADAGSTPCETSIVAERMDAFFSLHLLLLEGLAIFGDRAHGANVLSGSRASHLVSAVMGANDELLWEPSRQRIRQLCQLLIDATCVRAPIANALNFLLSSDDFLLRSDFSGTLSTNDHSTRSFHPSSA
jgi:hypothetical protein